MTALSLAAARGHRATLAALLAGPLAPEWPAARLADALASAIEQKHVECMTRLLEHREGLAKLASSFGSHALRPTKLAVQKAEFCFDQLVYNDK